MLTLLRKSVGTWVAKVFILLLVASFGVWGVSGALIGGVTGSVIEVGKTNVSANDYVLAYERARFGISRQFGRLLTRDELRTFGIEANILNQLVSGAVLDESARSMGLGLSNKSLATLIGEDTAFQDASGNFDRRVLNQQLRQLGMSEADYVENRQHVAVRNQLLEGVSANTTTSQVYLDAYDSYRNQKRKFEYVTISADFLAKKPEPTSDDIKAYYEANKTSFMAPEYRALTIVKLEASDISDPESITPQEIADEYEARKSDYTVDEKRAIQQLTLTDEAQGKSIAEKLKNGVLFETILEELGKTDTDISIGEYTKSTMPDTSVGDAAFALKLNEVSEVVTGIFGPVLLRVTQITPATVQPLKDVEGDLRTRLALVKAGEELFEMHDRLEDERAAGDTLAEAAAKVKLKVRNIDKIDATGKGPDGKAIEELPVLAKLLSEAFQTSEGVEADPISIGSEGYIWYEVKAIISDRQKTLDEIKDVASANWVQQETATAVEKIAIDLQAKLKSGDEFAASFAAILPEALKDKKVEDSAELSREDTSDDLNSASIRAGFAIEEQKTALAPGPAEGSQVVLKVVSILTGEGNSVGPDEKKRLDEAVGDDLLTQLVDDLRLREAVIIRQPAIIAAQNLIR